MKEVSSLFFKEEEEEKKGRVRERRERERGRGKEDKPLGQAQKNL